MTPIGALENRAKLVEANLNRTSRRRKRLILVIRSIGLVLHLIKQ
jgi:hypothetical protein